MRCVLTGPIGVGKSTVVRRIMDELGWQHPAGFCTHRVAGAPGTPSLLIATWTGESYPVAFWTGESGPPRLAAHRLDPDALAQFAARHLAVIPSDRPVVLDELGLLELDVPPFTSVVVHLFSRRAPVLAVIQQRVLELWLPRLEAIGIDRVDVVSVANRRELPRLIAAAFRASS